MSDKRCKCTMAISMVGDGCRYCQPQEYIDRLEEWLQEERQAARAQGGEAVAWLMYAEDWRLFGATVNEETAYRFAAHCRTDAVPLYTNTKDSVPE